MILSQKRADDFFLTALTLFPFQNKAIDGTADAALLTALTQFRFQNKAIDGTADAALLTALTLFPFQNKAKDGTGNFLFPCQLFNKKVNVMDEDQFWRAAEVVIETRIQYVAQFVNTTGHKGREFYLMQDKAQELQRVMEEVLEKACIKMGTTKDAYEASEEAYATSGQGQKRLVMLTQKIKRKLLEKEANNMVEKLKPINNTREVKGVFLEKEEMLALEKMYMEAIGHCIGAVAGLIGYTDADDLDLSAILRDPATGPHLQQKFLLAKMKLLEEQDISLDVFHASLQKYSTEPELNAVVGIEKIIRQFSSNNTEVKGSFLEKEEMLALEKMYMEAIGHCIGTLAGLIEYTDTDDLDLYAMLRDPATGPYLQKEFLLAKMKLLEEQHISLDVFHTSLQKYSTEPELNAVVGIEQIIQHGVIVSSLDDITSFHPKLDNKSSSGVLPDKEARRPACDVASNLITNPAA